MDVLFTPRTLWLISILWQSTFWAGVVIGPFAWLLCYMLSRSVKEATMNFLIVVMPIIAMVGVAAGFLVGLPLALDGRALNLPF